MIKPLFSKQKWLLKDIPSKSTSSDDLVRYSLFSILTHFVQEQKGLENNYWTEDDEGESVKEKLEKCYNWIKNDRDVLLSKTDQVQAEFPEVPENDGLFKFINDNHIKDILKLEKELREKDNKVLEIILKYREYLTITR
jgi:hypothetical protein